jgi:hypothetical protein
VIGSVFSEDSKEKGEHAMFEAPLEVALYMERRPLTEEWLHALLFRLWERGLHYNRDYAAAPLTWDEELSVLTSGIVTHGNKEVPLRDAIQRIVAAGFGSIKAYDKEVALDLFIDPAGAPDNFEELDELGVPDDFPKRFGQVGISIHGPYFEKDHHLPLTRELPIGAYMLAPYQQIMLAGIHWMEVLCEECHPIFGIGYDTSCEAIEEDEREVIEAPLYEGRLPDQSVWGPLMYISARFVNDDFLLSRLAEPGRWLKRMNDGGIFMRVPSNEHAYENAEAYRQLQQGETAQEQHDFSRAVQHYKRAMGIFQSISNDLGVWQSEQNIKEIDWERRREERKGVSPRQDVLS